MTLPKLRTGLCTIAGRRYAAIFGDIKGAREIFIGGIHIDRFCAQLPEQEQLEEWGMRFDLGGHAL